MPLSVPRRRLLRKLSAACVLLLFGMACRQRADFDPTYHEYAYISDGKSDSVSVIDTLALRNVKTIPVGKNPTGLADNPVRNEIYVANT